MLEPGHALGPYRIVEPLGAGGMGEVYAAQDTRLGRKVAVKVLPEQFACDPERLARFEQEARAAAALNHPHIAAVFDVGVAGDGAARTHFMVQELLDGQSLRALLQRGRPALNKSLDLCVEIAEALAAAHGAGIVHRDLKPENVFVSKDGHAKVLDFGLAKLTELSAIASPGGASRSPTVIGTVAGQVMGTAGYMAPEQVEGGDIDHRADLFAFGVVLYEATAGQQPFAGKNVIDTLHKITNLEPQPLREIDEKLPAELQRILHKALAKDPAARYQSAADVAVDLRGLAADVQAERAVSLATAGAGAVASGMPAWSLAATAAIAVVATAAVAWMLRPAPMPVAPLRVFDIDYLEGQTAPNCCGSQLALAPDGSFLVYAAGQAGRADLFLRRFDRPEIAPIALAGTAGSGGPAVSPDGQWVVYAGQAGGASGGANRGLYKVALAGGAPFRLTESTGAFPIWADDGYIFYALFQTGLHRVPENGGAEEPVAVVGLPEGTQIRHISVLPGRRAAVADAWAGRSSSIGVLQLEGGEWTVLADEGADPRYIPTGHVLFQRSGTVYALPFDADSLAASGPAVPVLQGVRVDSSGAAQLSVAHDGTLAWQAGSGAGSNRRLPKRLLAGAADDALTPLSGRVEPYLADLAVSPDGLRVAVVVSGAESRDVWVLDIAQGTLARLTVTGDNTSPVWSPDGQWIYYAADGGTGDFDVWRRPSDFSADPEPVLRRDRNQGPSGITPSGDALLFDEGTSFADVDIGILPLDGAGEARLLVQQAEFRETNSTLSPDGRHFAFTSNESATQQVYVRELEGQRRWLISPESGAIPLWSPDGRTLYYNAGTGAVMAVDIAAGETFSAGAPRHVRDLDDNTYGPYDVFPDGRLLYLADVGSSDTEDATAATVPTGFNIVVNWFEELRRLAPPER